MHVKGTFIFLFDWIVTFGTQPLYNSLSSDCYISISRTFSFLFVWSVILGSGAPLGFFLMGLLRWFLAHLEFFLIELLSYYLAYFKRSLSLDCYAIILPTWRTFGLSSL